jgi:hypothetical protein
MAAAPIYECKFQAACEGDGGAWSGKTAAILCCSVWALNGLVPPTSTASTYYPGCTTQSKILVLTTERRSTISFSQSDTSRVAEQLRLQSKVPADRLPSIFWALEVDCPCRTSRSAQLVLVCPPNPGSLLQRGQSSSHPILVRTVNFACAALLPLLSFRFPGKSIRLDHRSSTVMLVSPRSS